MGVSRTKTIKNRISFNKSASSSGGKSSKYGGGSKSKKPSGKAPSTQVKGRPSIVDLIKKKKQRVYTEKELGIPNLNMITPVGVQKPKGKKKGKVFVDDPESINTILAMVQAEKEGQIESKIMKARQMEEIREARRAEAEKKEAEKKAKLDATKESLRKKRNRNTGAKDDINVNDVAATGSKATRTAPKKKRVSFA